MKFALCALCHTGHCGKQLKSCLKTKRVKTDADKQTDIEIESNRATK